MIAGGILGAAGVALAVIGMWLIANADAADYAELAALRRALGPVFVAIGILIVVLAVAAARNGRWRRFAASAVSALLSLELLVSGLAAFPDNALLIAIALPLVAAAWLFFRAAWSQPGGRTQSGES